LSQMTRASNPSMDSCVIRSGPSKPGSRANSCVL
jgi:hypothetical protein